MDGSGAITRFDSSRFCSWSRTSCWRLRVSARTPHPTAAIHLLPARMNPDRLFHASGSIQAISGSRPGALTDSVGARGTCRRRVGRPSLVLAEGVDEAASARGADLHRRRRSGWLQREDPVDVSCAVGEVAGRAKPRGSGPPTGWLSDFRQQPFARISSTGRRGAASYASIINVPHPGCWRLDLRSRGLSGHIQFRAVPGRG